MKGVVLGILIGFSFASCGRDMATPLDGGAGEATDTPLMAGDVVTVTRVLER